MNERDFEAEEPPPRCLVDELGAFVREMTERRLDVIRLEGYVMHAGTAPREESPDVRVLARRRKELHTALADEQRGCAHSLLEELVTPLESRTEKSFVSRDRLVEVHDRDPEMMDPAQLHAGDATCASPCNNL